MERSIRKSDFILLVRLQQKGERKADGEGEGKSMSKSWVLSIVVWFHILRETSGWMHSFKL